MKYDNKTTKVLNIFEEINKIPRKSKHEEKIAEFLLKWGKDNNFITIQDKIKNVIIRVPGKGKLVNKETVVLQGHMDMVCEKLPEIEHDFFNDPIEHIIENDWLKAKGTTLGADNGIALAIAMTIATDNSIEHPPLELLFTVDEETGLTGALNLEPNLLKGKILINIDSENEGIFTIGCAGGKDTEIRLQILKQKNPENMKSFGLKVGGLFGGHSGIDINKQRGNAIKILARILKRLFNECDKILLTDFQGGTAHNAIPRDAIAGICIPNSFQENLYNIVKKIEEELKNEFTISDPNLFIQLGKSSLNDYIVEGKNIIDIIRALPHGVTAVDLNSENLVETSNNLAKANIIDNEFKVLTSQRSSIMSRLNSLTEKIEIIAQMGGANTKSGNGYPAWQPNWDSPLVKKCENIYEKLFNKKCKIEVIHAGLECGLIGSKYPEMDMVSIGPTIKNPHSPEEKLKISDIIKIWDFLIALMKDL